MGSITTDFERMDQRIEVDVKLAERLADILIEKRLTCIKFRNIELHNSARNLDHAPRIESKSGEEQDATLKKLLDKVDSLGRVDDLTEDELQIIDYSSQY